MFWNSAFGFFVGIEKGLVVICGKAVWSDDAGSFFGGNGSRFIIAVSILRLVHGSAGTSFVLSFSTCFSLFLTWYM